MVTLKLSTKPRRDAPDFSSRIIWSLLCVDKKPTTKKRLTLVAEKVLDTRWLNYLVLTPSAHTITVWACKSFLRCVFQHCKITSIPHPADLSVSRLPYQEKGISSQGRVSTTVKYNLKSRCHINKLSPWTKKSSMPHLVKKRSSLSKPTLLFVLES